MFREREMTQALNWLMGLYTPEDCDGIDMESLMEYIGCDISEVCQGLRNNTERVYEYAVTGDAEGSFAYRGNELFEQRAILLGISDMYGEESEAINVCYRKELWLLEDMTFAIVRCVHFNCEDSDNHFETDYRTIMKRMEGREDLFIAPDDLLEELMMMCVPIGEGDAVIFEM